MSKLQFEEFLANLFCSYIASSDSIDTKYHFVSSNPSQSIQLYNGFKKLGFKLLQLGSSCLNYIETENNKKIILMLHHLGEQDKNSSHEDFIAKIRDALNDIDNAVLFVINNSSLETLTSTFTDVSVNDGVFTPEYVNSALIQLGQGHPDELIFKYLVANTEKKINEENLSIFGYESLYNSIHKERIDLKEHGFFYEPRLSDICIEKDLRKELDKNNRLSKIINSCVHEFGDDASELQRQLEDIGLGERYIKEKFIQDKSAYKSETFSSIEAEIEKNKDRKLDVFDIELNGIKISEWKRFSETSSSRKNISLIGEVLLGEVELKIKMLRGEPPLKLDQISVHGDLKNNQVQISTSNYDFKSVLSIKFSFEGDPSFVQVKFKRPSQKECFQFNCCFVLPEVFYLKNIFEKLEVEIKRNKGKLILENIQGKLVFNSENTKIHIFSNIDTKIDCEDLREIDFSGVEESELIGDFELVSGNSRLPLTITAAKVVDSIKLPSLFDTQRTLDIFSNERIPKFKPATSRVVMGGREKELSVKAKELCFIEYQLINKQILFIGENDSNKLSINDFEADFPEIANAYRNLFDWLANNETILSITNWPTSLVSLVENVLTSIKKELMNIPSGSLDARSRLLMSIGVIKQEEEFLTPFHPVCLSYAFEFAKLRVVDKTNSFQEVPSTTVDKFNASGLLPVLFDEKASFVRTQALSHNKLWLEVVSNLVSGENYVAALVQEKIQDFLTCFEMLFKHSEDAPLIINSINNQQNIQIFKGIINYLKKAKGKIKKIRVNIYDEGHFQTLFEKFSETRDINKLRDLVCFSNSDKDSILDDLILKFRKNVIVYKVDNYIEYEYAHLSFFKNNEEVTMRTNSVNEGKSGIVCNGILSGEASYLENEVFYTGFGLKNVQSDSLSVCIASLYNQLLLAYRDKSAKYIKGNVPVLAVQDSFRDRLSKSYRSSIWTCIIDPKVTLEFFDTKETILIHYADQYTNSVAYDAITVSSRIGLYKDLLQSQSDELINSFNALNGQWLLSIVRESGKIKTPNTQKQIREKQGIVAAYKFLSSLLLHSDLTWIPLSVGEMLRVTGNLGLEIKDSDFSARLHNKSKGALSDDILFVGIKNEQLVLLPLEVKSRRSGTDFSKAIQQSKALTDHMKRLLEPRTFKGQVYRSLFIQQILTQVDKFELYNVFPKDYFLELHAISDLLLQGQYKIFDLVNYPEGIALAVNEGMERSRIEYKKDPETNVLKVRLPQAFVSMLHEESIENLSKKFNDKSAYPDVSKIILLTSELNIFRTDKEEYFEVEQILADEIDCGSEGVEREIIKESLAKFKAQFDYPDYLTDIVEKIVELYLRDISIEDVLSLTESDIENFENFEDKDLLSFYRLKSVLSINLYSPEQKNQTTGKIDGSQLLTQVNVTSEFKALVNTILREFGNNITINEIFKLDISLLERINGFGKGKVNKFLNFVELIKQGSFSISGEDLHQQIENFDLPLNELEIYLIDDLESYFHRNSRENDVLSRRLGIDCCSETLEEIGKTYGITRERIRQIECKAKKNFIAKLSISPKVIWAITRSNLSELRAPLFADLRRKFTSDKNFYSFLEVCCGLEENEIKKVTSPNISKSIFEEFWVWNKSPAPLEDLSWYLHENMNIELAVAENQIAIWIKDNLLVVDGENIKPISLSKVSAITNALLDFPAGNVWSKIQSHANNKSVTGNDILENRLEPNLMRAVDREYVYQSGRGTYRHLKYLNIDEADVKRVLNVVLTKLKEYKYAERESVNLFVDIFQRVDLADDYFFVRHIVRSFGESEGIYFNGKSGADTVSLLANFTLVSQKTVLIDLFKQSLNPLSKQDIASKIRSQSLGHAAFYLDKLLTDGNIVRIDETTYAHIDNAFEGVDVEGIIKLAINFIDNESRIIEGEKLQSMLNRHLGNNYNKYFYISLLKVYSEQYGKHYSFVHNLISNSKIEYSSLTDMCREALDKDLSRIKTMEYLNSKLCIHEHVLKRCLDQLSNLQKSFLKNEKSNGNSQVFKEEEPKFITDVTETLIDTLMEHAVEAPSSLNFENCRILVGRAIDNQKNVYWEYGNKDLPNRHLIVFGRSGQGKTYCIQGLLMELAKFDLNSMVIDYTNGFLPEHLEEEFINQVKPKTDLIVHKPLAINPFHKQTQKVAGIDISDRTHDVASRVASVFNAVYSDIGSQQLPTLIKVIEDGIELYGKDYNFIKMLDDLQTFGKHGEALANKLHPMVRANLFSFSQECDGWNDIYFAKPSTTRLIQLARLSRDIWQLATEFILWDLYSYACTNGNKNNPIPVVLDEVQNLDQKLDSPLGKMLTEGRKYGLSLILATQTLSNLKKDEQDRLFQAAHKLFFAPAETEIQSYAKLLEQAVPGSNKKAWLEELAKLKKGECISVGLHMNECGFVEQGAKVIKVASLSERA